MTRTLLSAHEAGPEDGYAPNSLAAATAIRDSGVDLIEFDVRVTRDDKFVTVHDHMVSIDGQPVDVSQLTATEVLQSAPGSSLLETMLQTIKDHAIAHVDLKDNRLEVAIVDVCEAILGKHGYIITTVNDDSVRKIRQERPEAQVALTLGRDTTGMSKWQDFKIRLSERYPARRVARCQPTMLALCYREAWPNTLRFARRHHLPVLLWTLNSPELMERAWNNPDIWAFSTDYPREALAESHRHPHRGWLKSWPASHKNATEN